MREPQFGVTHQKLVRYGKKRLTHPTPLITDIFIATMAPQSGMKNSHENGSLPQVHEERLGASAAQPPLEVSLRSPLVQGGKFSCSMPPKGTPPLRLPPHPLAPEGVKE
jgi:hypothetical protein